MTKIFICIAFLLTLCGCFDYNELNMQELVSGAGVDSTDDGVNVVVSCASTKSEEESEGALYTAEGNGFFDAVRSVTGISDKKLYWGHAKCIVFGENAVSEIDGVLDAVLRARDIYLDVTPVIARGASAKEIFKSKPQSGTDAVESITGAFGNESNSRRFRALAVWEIMRLRGEKKPYILPVVTIEEEAPRVEGGAVIKDSKLAGYLSGEQMLLLSLLTDEGDGGYLPTLSLSDKRQVSPEILSNDLKIEHLGDGSIKIKQKCVLSPAEVRGEVSGDEMRSAAKSFLETGYESLISYAEKNGFEDILGEEKISSVECDIRISDILGGGK